MQRSFRCPYTVSPPAGICMVSFQVARKSPLVVGSDGKDPIDTVGLELSSFSFPKLKGE